LLLLVSVVAWFTYRLARIIELRSLAMEAATAFQAEHWGQLEDVSRQWTKKDPNAGTAWYLAGEAAKYRGSPVRMAGYFERLPDDHVKKPIALLDLATACFGPLNQPSRGEAACLKSLQLAPDNVEARRRLVFYYCITLQRTKMVQFAREAIANQNDLPETYAYLIGADWITLSNAAPFNRSWLNSDDDPENYLVAYLIHWAGTTGISSMSTDDDARKEARLDLQASPELQARIKSLLGRSTNQNEAIVHLQRIEQCLERYPNNPELLAFQLKRAAASGNVSEVRQLLSQVPQSAAGDNRFFHYKGWLHDALGEPELAVEAYRNALRLNPFDWRSQLRLAVTLRLLGETDEADRLAGLAMHGKQLRETIMQLADVQSIPMPVMESMYEYCQACGDELVAEGLLRRIKMFRNVKGLGNAGAAPVGFRYAIRQAPKAFVIRHYL